MIKLKIDAYKINVYTTKGLFGTAATFTDGLNILRAKNSTGKSSCINAILYGLGMEELLGSTNSKTMKPVLREEISYQGEKHGVIESNVQLQVSNASGKVITVTRWIVSSSKDEKLISIQFGPTLTNSSETYESKDFYVHSSGSATNEAGFHSLLVDFIGWELPFVPSFEGKDRILYMQFLFPLFFIEQIKGWSSFYTSPTTNYGIRDLATRALEFILGLEVYSNSRIKDELKIRKAVLEQEWLNIVNSIREKAKSIDAIVQNLNDKPDLLSEFNVVVYNHEQNLMSISSRLFELKETLKYNRNTIRNIQDVEQEHELIIDGVEEVVLVLQNELNQIRKEINSETINREALEYNIIQMKHDLKTNQDAQRLYTLGSDKNLFIAQGICPTCNQSIHDSLLPQDIDFQPMTLEENIKYIKEQLDALMFGVNQSRNIIGIKNRKLNSISKLLEEERRKLRSLKYELREDPRMPSELELEDVLNLKWKIKELEEVCLFIEESDVKFHKIKENWKKYLSDRKQIPEEFFSDLDKDKLNTFKAKFVFYLMEFGYSSTPLSDISISDDKFTPIVKGFDVKFDSSASDYIRLIWAFNLALEYVTKKHGGNHPKLIVMDEPGQQQMNIQSMGKLFEQLSNLGGQSIIASSLTMEEVLQLSSDINVNVIDLGNDYVFTLIV